MAKKTTQRSGCPVGLSLDIWGDRWSLLIIRDLMFYDIHFFRDFLRSKEKIATNILTDRLAHLEEAGMIVKEPDPGTKTKFKYSLTEMGIDMLPMAVEINLWYDRHFPVDTDFRQIIEPAKKDKDGFIKQHYERLRKSLIK